MSEPHCKRLDDYLDGMLSPSDNRQFEVHVEGCEACRDAVQLEKMIGEAARSATQDTLVPSEVYYHTRRTLRHWQLRRRIYWSAGGVAVILVGCFFAYRLVTENNSREPGRENIAHQDPPMRPDNGPRPRVDVPEIPPAMTMAFSAVMPGE